MKTTLNYSVIISFFLWFFRGKKSTNGDLHEHPKNLHLHINYNCV